MPKKKKVYIKDLSRKRMNYQFRMTPMIIKIFQFVLLVLTLSHTAFATKIVPTDIQTLVKKADYIIIGEVVKVDMVDKNSKLVIDGNARTGPGSPNTILLHVRLNRENVIKGKKSNIPEFIIVPEWQMWHMSLQGAKGLEGETFIFLLNKNFKPSSAPEFRRSLWEQGEIERYAR